jgi:hypothetical protein
VTVVPSHNWSHANGRPYRYWNYRGHPWYGFYIGPRYYWARWYGNNWWWYDSQFARWAFWYDGYWWWNAPTGITYVYVNNAYTPYDEGVVNVAPPTAVGTPPTDGSVPPSVQNTEPAAINADQTATSPDGRRMVQIVGPSSEAFLYDTSSGKPVFMKYLAKDVQRARFDGGQNGKPLQILVDYKTNSDFTLFDSEGRPQGGSILPQTAEASAISPAKMPAPPAPLPE